MGKELKVFTEQDRIIASIYGVAEHLDVLYEKYPRAVSEVLLNKKIEIRRDNWRYKERKAEDLRTIVEAQLQVDILKSDT